jgi:glycerate kinase
VAGAALHGRDGTRRGHRGGLYRSPVRVLAAPDKFKGTLTAAEAAAAVAEGWRRGRPGDEVEELPMADGGEGTLDTLVAALGGRIETARVTGPLGDPVDATFGLIDGDRVAVVEMARASGLGLVPEHLRDPKITTTRGTGELILAACERSPHRVIVCICGSATNDGAAGMVQALGVRLLDRRGLDLGPGGAALLDLERIDVSGLSPLVNGVKLVVASDVDNPLTGPRGAAAVYGPQKGASPQDVELLDRALARYAEVIRRDLAVDVDHRPGAGACGGMGAGFMAFLDATFRPGVEVVMEANGFRGRLDGAGLVITGEGKLDEQSMHGKTPDGVLRAAREAGVPAIVVCGQATVRLDGVRVGSITEHFGSDRAFSDAAGALADLVAELAGEWP